jgi:hypothetical protein
MPSSAASRTHDCCIIYSTETPRQPVVPIRGEEKREDSEGTEQDLGLLLVKSFISGNFADENLV